MRATVVSGAARGDWAIIRGVVSPYLHALSCSKCGAALPATPGQQLLTCQYCGQSHAFVPPPPAEGRGTRYRQGERVAVEWGRHWWPATVAEPVGTHEWRVHFDDWDHEWDVVVGPSRIRHVSQATRRRTARAHDNWVPAVVVVVAALILLSGAIVYVSLGPSVTAESTGNQGPGNADTTYQRGQSVDIWSGATWYVGRVLEVKGSSYQVSYEGWSSHWDEWVDATRLRPRSQAPATVTATQHPANDAPPPASSAVSFRAGDAVSIEWKGTWYKGRVLETKADRYKITYDGYSSNWDEWVESDRLRPQ